MCSRIFVGLFYSVRHITDVSAVGISIETSVLDKGIKKLDELTQQGPRKPHVRAGRLVNKAARYSDRTEQEIYALYCPKGLRS